jgi:hypothetical protein
MQLNIELSIAGTLLLCKMWRPDPLGLGPLGLLTPLVCVVAIPFVFAMEMVRSVLSDYPGLNLILYGPFLIIIMIHYPGGLAHLYDTIVAYIRSVISSKPLKQLDVGSNKGTTNIRAKMHSKH